MLALLAGSAELCVPLLPLPAGRVGRGCCRVRWRAAAGAAALAARSPAGRLPALQAPVPPRPVPVSPLPLLPAPPPWAQAPAAAAPSAAAAAAACLGAWAAWGRRRRQSTTLEAACRAAAATPAVSAACRAIWAAGGACPWSRRRSRWVWVRVGCRGAVSLVWTQGALALGWWHGPGPGGRPNVQGASGIAVGGGQVGREGPARGRERLRALGELSTCCAATRFTPLTKPTLLSSRQAPLNPTLEEPYAGTGCAAS